MDKAQALALWKLRFGRAGFISLNVIIAMVIILAGIYVSLHTKFSRNIYTIGGSETSALLMAIPVKRTKVLIYTINGFCSAMAGVVFCLYMLSGYGLHGQGRKQKKRVTRGRCGGGTPAWGAAERLTAVAVNQKAGFGARGAYPPLIS
jgi:ABC-type xylose transport system permease subunit